MRRRSGGPRGEQRLALFCFPRARVLAWRKARLSLSPLLRAPYIHTRFISNNIHPKIRDPLVGRRAAAASCAHKPALLAAPRSLLATLAPRQQSAGRQADR